MSGNMDPSAFREGKDGKTALHIAACGGFLDVVVTLLKYGVDIACRDEFGSTALHMAAGRGFLEIVEILLKYSVGMEIDYIDDYGRTALHIAASKKFPAIVKTLLKFGADIDSRDKAGRTALHISVSNQFLRNGPLHACDGGDREVVMCLLDYGSDINIMDQYNNTPLKLAKSFLPPSFRQLRIIQILNQHIFKMKVANLYVDGENLHLTRNCYKFTNFPNECKEEIQSMKREKISNTNLSFFDILTSSVNQLTMYARNEDIKQVLKLDSYRTKFPIYASMISSQFRRGMERKELIEQGNKLFNSLLNSFSEFPYICTEKILSYLSNKDVRVLIYTCKHSNVSSPDIADTV